MLHFTRDDVRRRVVLTGDGQTSLNDWTSSTERILEEEAWGYATLYDFTAPDATLPTAFDVTTITKLGMQLVTDNGPRGPVAFAVDDESEYLHTRGWIDSVGQRVPWPVAAFRTIVEAEAWLAAREHGSSAPRA
jgi:hypothetical protein